jgi:4'-phosphopantetheinyl transferase
MRTCPNAEAEQAAMPNESGHVRLIFRMCGMLNVSTIHTVNKLEQKITRATPVAVEPPYVMPATPADMCVGKALDAQTVEFWLLSREALQRQAERFCATLSIDEQLRRDRFIRVEDRVRFNLYRGALRTVLSLYVAVPPHQIRFRVAGNGKPELHPDVHTNAPRFNLSHSDDACCIAIARTEVGVDVESLDRTIEPLGVARHAFHPAEASALSAMDDAARRALFTRWWTAKEAFFKARGLGLAGGLSRLDLSHWQNGEAARIVDETGTAWILRSYEFGRWVVTLASVESVRSIILRSISGPGAASGELITRSS